MTVLVAPNGQGKTSLLDAIKVALWPYVAGFDLGSTTKDVTGIDIDDVRYEQIGHHQMEARLPVRIEAKGFMQAKRLIQEGILQDPALQRQGEPIDLLTIFNSDVPWQSTRCRDSIRSNTKTKDDAPVDALNIKKSAKALEQRVFSGKQDIPDDLPMLGYYGTGRLWAQKNYIFAKEKIDSRILSRTFSYRDCLDPASSYKHFAKWFSHVYQAYFQAQMRNFERGFPVDANVAYGLIAAVKAVQQVVDTILKPHTGWHSLEYSAEYAELVLQHDQQGELKVSQLSDGIRTMLGLVGDIAYRCYKLNSHLGESAPQRTHGIVMIDEVDMHLHPSWQQTVLTDLMAAFPKLQFIVTTHSPQVLTTVESECIRILHERDVYAAPAGSQGAAPERMLKSILGLEAVRPPHNPATKELLEYLFLVNHDQWASPQALELRRKLDARYQGNEPALLEADLLIENRKWELGE